MIVIANFNSTKKFLYACTSLHTMASSCSRSSREQGILTAPPLLYHCSRLLARKEQRCDHSDQDLSMLGCKINSGRDIDGDLLPKLNSRQPKLNYRQPRGRPHHQINRRQ